MIGGLRTECPAALRRSENCLSAGSRWTLAIWTRQVSGPRASAYWRSPRRSIAASIGEDGARAPATTPISPARAAPLGVPGGSRRLQPVLVLDDLPECVFVDDLVALKSVDVAALVIEVLAIGAPAAHGPYRDRAIPGENVVLVLPAHIGDLLEAVGERLPYRRLAFQGAPDRFRPARQAKHPVLGKALDDALDIAAVERRRDLPHQLHGHHS